MDYSSYKHMTFERRDRILTMTFDHADTLNAVDNEMHGELSRVFYDIALDDETDIVIVTGAGRAFSAGGDIAGMQEMLDKPHLFELSIFEAKKIIFGILDCDKPIICKMNGDAVGLGATLALYCDIIFAADHARIGDPHVRVALSAGDGGAVIWPQLIGFARAKEYLMTGDLITAPDAAAMGLINHSVPAEELDARVDAFADKLARGATKSIKWTKVSINIALKQLAHTMMDTCMAYEALSNGTGDHAEAVAAFTEKRKPKFTGA
ncbi:MAG: enoyl-CoA hydratase-related protein [Pseudomonadota bacterium]